MKKILHIEKHNTELYDNYNISFDVYYHLIVRFWDNNFTGFISDTTNYHIFVGEEFIDIELKYLLLDTINITINKTNNKTNKYSTLYKTNKYSTLYDVKTNNIIVVNHNTTHINKIWIINQDIFLIMEREY